MISVDTNILVRILTCDDDLQMRKALALFEHNNIFITDTVILETEWVLRYAYEFSGPDINDALGRLLGLPQVHVAHPRQIADALIWHKHGLDFSDVLHLSASNTQDSFFTFDRQFV
ncbi:MAG: type II toxin-antitoxin system VapC family toxin, partial [Mariprofundaceae bacterium]|nr:type II toxin-antitoxin system VapC family toxin [Mariprofundaceae bacterium]